MYIPLRKKMPDPIISSHPASRAEPPRPAAFSVTVTSPLALKDVLRNRDSTPLCKLRSLPGRPPTSQGQRPGPDPTPEEPTVHPVPVPDANSTKDPATAQTKPNRSRTVRRVRRSRTRPRVRVRRRSETKESPEKADNPPDGCVSTSADVVLTV